jgi:hypothetical protein
LEAASNDVLDVLNTLDDMGLQAHEAFMTAGSLACNVEIERIRAGISSGQHLHALVNGVLTPTATQFNEQWLSWNARRFGEVRHNIRRGPGAVGNIIQILWGYRFEGKWTVVHSWPPKSWPPKGSPAFPVITGVMEEGKAKAEALRQARLDSEAQKLKDKYIEPSHEIIKKWKEAADRFPV